MYHKTEKGLTQWSRDKMDDILADILYFLYENCRIMLQASLKFVSNGSIINNLHWFW